MFVNPKIDSWIMNQVMFAVSKNPDKYLQILPYMNEHLNFGTLSKIIEFKEQNRCDDIDKLLHVWQDLPHNETRKLQLQNLICRGIEFSDNLYHCSPEEFELTYKELNYKHMGLDFLLQ
jgi:hypothetical protein